MMAVYARSEPRFRRTYVQPVRRRWFARRLALFMHMGLALAAAGGAAWSFDALRGADILRIDTVTVEGNRRLSSGEVAGLLEVLRGENLLVADLEARTRERARVRMGPGGGAAARPALGGARDAGRA